VRIFLDVGAHTGQTLAAVIGLGFDQIHCFEPAAICWPALEKLAERQATVWRFGLWNQTTTATLYEPGRPGAGLWLKDSRAAMKDHTQPCRVVRASDWFAEHIGARDRVYLKLNCEGCECDVIDDLLDSGEFDKVAYLMVDFDARKIADLKHRPAQVMARLAPFPPPRVLRTKQAMIGGTHRDRIRHWLGGLPQ